MSKRGTGAPTLYQLVGEYAGLLASRFGWRRTTALVLVSILSHRSEREPAPWVGRARLAAETGLSESVVKRAIAELRNTSWRGKPLLVVGDDTRSSAKHFDGLEAMYAELVELPYQDRLAWVRKLPGEAEGGVSAGPPGGSVRNPRGVCAEPPGGSLQAPRGGLCRPGISGVPADPREYESPLRDAVRGFSVERSTKLPGASRRVSPPASPAVEEELDRQEEEEPEEEREACEPELDASELDAEEEACELAAEREELEREPELEQHQGEPELKPEGEASNEPRPVVKPEPARPAEAEQPAPEPSSRAVAVAAHRRRREAIELELGEPAVQRALERAGLTAGQIGALVNAASNRAVPPGELARAALAGAGLARLLAVVRDHAAGGPELQREEPEPGAQLAESAREPATAEARRAALEEAFRADAVERVLISRGWQPRDVARVIDAAADVDVAPAELAQAARAGRSPAELLALVRSRSAINKESRAEGGR